MSFDLIDTNVQSMEDDVLERKFAVAYSEAFVLDKGGARRLAALKEYKNELEDRGLDPKHAADIHGCPVFECPECGDVGVHDHPTDGVRSCDSCLHACGVAHFAASH